MKIAKITTAEAHRATLDRHEAQAELARLRAEMVDDQLEGKSLTAARRSEFGRLRALANSQA